MSVDRPRRPIPLYLLLAVFAILVLFPLLFALSISVQGPTIAPRLIPDPRGIDFGVYARVFAKEPLLGRWILNSLVVSLAVMAGQLATATLAAYALAMFSFRGVRVALLFFLGTMMIPWESTILSNYLLIAQLRLKDTYTALIAPFLAGGFGVFLLRQYFKSIPLELHEAAALEGCGRFRYLWGIFVPLARPALATLAVYVFLNTWNQYYWPLLAIDSPIWRTTQIGITAFRSTEIASFDLQMAATIVVMLPTLLLLFAGQKQLVAGLTGGALKG